MQQQILLSSSCVTSRQAPSHYIQLKVLNFSLRSVYFSSQIRKTSISTEITAELLKHLLYLREVAGTISALRSAIVEVFVVFLGYYIQILGQRPNLRGPLRLTSSPLHYSLSILTLNVMKYELIYGKVKYIFDVDIQLLGGFLLNFMFELFFSETLSRKFKFH
jgi:hypothetical protein